MLTKKAQTFNKSPDAERLAGPVIGYYEQALEC